MTDGSNVVRISVTLSRMLKAKVVAAAGRKGIRYSEWVRTAILEKLDRDAAS